MQRSAQSRFAALAVDLSGDEPPREFRIFRKGENATEQGPFTFDAQAAATLMAAYQAHAVDRMIDLEHLSLDTESRAYDPNARGWCRLELRGGELWATDVRWTDDGAARLRAKTQRYVSPTFEFDADRRPIRIINIALTALPATHGAQALMAASTARGRTALGGTMNADTAKKAMAILEGKDESGALELLKGMMAEAMTGDAPAEEPPPEEEALAEDPPEEPEDENGAAMMAAATSLMRLTGKATLGGAVREVETYRASHLALEGERDKLTKERAALELTERKALVADLVKLGVELPATAWDATGKRPCARLTAEPLADLRGRVALLKAAPRTGAIRPPTGGTVDAHGLTERELAICADMKCPPAKFAALKSRRVNTTTGAA